MDRYGVRINTKGGPMIIELPQPYEWRNGCPIFALGNGDGSSNLESAADIRTNWNAWAHEYFPGKYHPRLSIEQAEKEQIEIL